MSHKKKAHIKDREKIKTAQIPAKKLDEHKTKGKY